MKLRNRSNELSALKTKLTNKFNIVSWLTMRDGRIHARLTNVTNGISVLAWYDSLYEIKHWVAAQYYDDPELNDILTYLEHQYENDIEFYQCIDSLRYHIRKLHAFNNM